NSRAEGLLIGVRFEDTQTLANVYPLYVKNRDPRVNYQPKILQQAGAERVLRFLAEISGPMGGDLRIQRGRGTLTVHRPAVGRKRTARHKAPSPRVSQGYPREPEA